MHRIYKTILLGTLFLFSTLTVSAQHKVTFESYPVQLNQPLLKIANSHQYTPATKKIQLLRLKISQGEKEKFIKKIFTKKMIVASNSTVGDKADLDMNQTPVLDQGMHGTCVTFATSAALDAQIGQGDYISQLCQLTLGNTLSQTTGNPSGWEGSSAKVLLEQFQQYGFITKISQLTQGCGGLYEYPLLNPVVPNNNMSVMDFLQLHETLDMHHIKTDKIVDIPEIIFGNANKEELLNKVKQSIKFGHRVVFGTILADSTRGVAGATGSYVAALDTWVPSTSIINHFKEEKSVAAHEMVITGFDDNAVVLDEDANPHTGLIKLRNSWGIHAGNMGEFYMTYDYFKLFILEAHTVSPN